LPTKKQKPAKEDEPADPIFEYLKMLKSQKRISLLKTLFEEKKPVTFMELLRKANIPKTESSDAAYHLGPLKEKGIVIQEDTKYFLSGFGEDLLGKFFEMEDILASFTSGIMIRTSRYSMEPFSEQKIAESLATEAGMPPDLAAEVARDTRIRLQQAKVKYLTAPLIREYVNAILIEKHLEDYRHKLTRLGLPGHEIRKRLREHGIGHLCEIQSDVGRETLEQFALLQVLPKTVADVLLQQRVGFENLAYFPYLPDEVVVTWADQTPNQPPTWTEVLLEILRIIQVQAPRAARHISIVNIPLPRPAEYTDLNQIHSLQRAVEASLFAQNKDISVFFSGEPSEWVKIAGNVSHQHGNPLEFLYNLPPAWEGQLPESGICAVVGSSGNIPPVFETLYCNLLYLIKWGENLEDARTPVSEIADLVHEIISLKQTAIHEYGGFYDFDQKMSIRIRPVGLSELTHYLRGFDVEQTLDSENYALGILKMLLEETGKRFDGNMDIILGQPAYSAHLYQFAEAALASHPELQKSLTSYTGIPTCSPGFLRPNTSLTAESCLELAARTIGKLPGGFFLNLPLWSEDNASLSNIPQELTTGNQNYFILQRDPTAKIQDVEISQGNFF